MKRGVLVLLISILLVAIAYGSNFSDFSQGDFNNGTYNNLTYLNGAVVLSGNNLSGTFTSRIFDSTTSSALWSNLSWNGNISSRELLFAVDAQADVWKSNSSGTNWSLIKDDYNGAEGNGVTFSFFNDSRDYFIIFNQDVWKSNDFGANWFKASNDYNGGESNNAIVGGIDKNGLFYIIEGDEDVWKSNNSGANWSKISTNFNGGNGNVGGFAVNNSNIFFAVDAQADVWKSNNSGINWTRVNDNYNGAQGDNVDDMVIDNEGTLYTLDVQDIWMSNNSGVNWTKINDDFNGPTDSEAGQSLAVNKQNILYVIDGGEDVFRSIDRGVTFTKISTNFNGGNGNIPTLVSLTVNSNISFQIRNCSLLDCADGIWQVFDLNNFNLTGRYFQYKADFISQETGLTSQLFNVSIGYTILDTLPPSVFIISPLNQTYNSNSILLNISVSDNSGVGSCNYTLDNGLTNYSLVNFGDYWTSVNSTISQGSQLVRFYCSDLFNNVNNTAIKYFFVDSVGPSINLALPESKTYGINTSLPLNFSVVDSGIGVNSCWYHLDNGSDFNIANCQNITFDVYEDGDHSIYLYSNDSLGNVGSANISFSVLTNAPALNLLSPENNSYLNFQDNVFFNYSITSGVGISTCELWGNFSGAFKLNQTKNSLIAGNNFFVLNLTDGNYNWEVRCNDTQNRFSNKNRMFSIDTLSPLISITQPSGIQSSRAGISLLFSVNDNSPIECKYNVFSGASLEITNTSVDCSLSSILFNVSKEGDFVLNFYVNDSAGNFNSTSSLFSVSTPSSSSSSSSSSSGGSSGGGSSGGGIIFSTKPIISGINNLEIEEISNLILTSNEEKKLSLNVRNAGTNFLNGCMLVAEGEYSSWISSHETKNLAAGEKYAFAFSINPPGVINAGDKQIQLILKCQEAKKSISFLVNILEKKINFNLINVKRISEGQVKVFYSLEEFSGIDQNAELQFLLLGKNGEKITELRETKKIASKSKGNFESILAIDPSLDGEFTLLVNLNSEKYSGFVQEDILVGKFISGFAIMGGKVNLENISIVALILFFLIFAFFIIKKILYQRSRLNKKETLTNLTKIFK